MDHALADTDARTETLSLDAFVRERDRLWFRYTIGGSPFTISLWYEGLDFFALEEKHGEQALQRLYFHIGAFNANQYASLAPRRIDFGPFAHFADTEFARLWRTIFVNVWAQWRYENDLPFYHGPEITVAPDCFTPIRYEPQGHSLLFSGGGKDSVVAQRLLSGAGQRYDSISYSHSIYGAAAYQHELIDRVLDYGSQERRHRISVFDDFLDSPVLKLRKKYGIRTLCAAETPASYFMTLPLVLGEGYDAAVVGHERSADYGNLRWDVTGEDVNHQWGKSYEAEALLDNYISSHLLSGFNIYSVLKPLSDVAIFNLASFEEEALLHAHSCNVRKPWCKRCPKCAYVWLNYRAYMPPGFADRVFGENLADVPENLIWFRQLIGREAHTPFECVGQPEEARLAFEICRRTGLTGLAMREFEAAQFKHDYAQLLSAYLQRDSSAAQNIPRPVFEAIKPWIDDRLAERRRCSSSTYFKKPDRALRRSSPLRHSVVRSDRARVYARRTRSL